MMSINKSFPKCTNRECFACEDGRCVILKETNFSRPCPFSKTRVRLAEEEVKRVERENRIEV